MHSIMVIGRKLRYCALLFAASLFFSGCMNEENLDQDIREGREAWVLLTVRMPKASLPAARAYSRQAELETLISDIHVMVFEDTGNGYTFVYQISGTEIEPVGDQQRFRTRVVSSEVPTKILILANTGALLTQYEPLLGTPEADVRRQSEFQFTSAGLSGSLPMYGELLLPDGVGEGNNNFTMTALRAIARVDVAKDLIEGTEEFILEEVHVFRVNDSGLLIPDAVADPSAPGVDTPSIPDGASFLTDPLSKTATGDKDAIAYIYIPESRAAETEADRLNGTTVIVVGGRYGGDESPITYYRADIDPGLPEHPFGQVLRNHLYTFNIKEVTGHGWSTPQDAAENYASSIVFDIQAWEDFSSDLYFGEDRFAVSSRSIDLRFVRDREKRLDVESTLEYTIQWLDASGDLTGDATSQLNNTISNDNFHVTIVRDDGDDPTVTHLVFRTRNNNHNGDVKTDRLRIMVNNWDIDITVRQDNTAVYSTRHFNVLTGHDVTSPYGNLGNTANPTALSSSGLAMRKILDVQFAPTGSIRIGGFAFDLVTDNQLSAVSMSVTGATNLAETNRVFRMQNVIFSSYRTLVSDPVADLLLAWLDENPRRVLIVSADDDQTNLNLRAKLNNDVTWSYNITAAGAHYLPAPRVTGVTDDFLLGPFGNVAVGAEIVKYDATLGYATWYSSDVTPLLVASTTQAMIVGINKTRRIIYLGDCNLFQISSMSNDVGEVRNDLDRLWANVWAWIVEQLVYGDE